MECGVKDFLRILASTHLQENAAALPTAACHFWAKNLDQRGGAVSEHAGKHTKTYNGVATVS